jgi:hypothetical protein
MPCKIIRRDLSSRRKSEMWSPPFDFTCIVAHQAPPCCLVCFRSSEVCQFHIKLTI